MALFLMYKNNYLLQNESFFKRLMNNDAITSIVVMHQIRKPLTPCNKQFKVSSTFNLSTVCFLSSKNGHCTPPPFTKPTFKLQEWVFQA